MVFHNVMSLPVDFLWDSSAILGRCWADQRKRQQTRSDSRVERPSSDIIYKLQIIRVFKGNHLNVFY